MTPHEHADPRNPIKMAPFAKVDAKVKTWVTEIIDHFDQMGNARVSEIENQSRDGFWAWTEGGWDGVIYDDLYYRVGAGTVPAMLQATADSVQKDCAADWNEQNPEHPYETLFGRTTEDEGQQRLSGMTSTEAEADEAHRNAFYEFENRWMSEGLSFFWKIRAIYYDVGNSKNVTGKPEVLFCVGLNDDFEYGRDSIGWLRSPSNGGPGSHWLWEKTVMVHRLTPKRLEKLGKEARDALANA